MNQINAIKPYLWQGQWVFDDPDKGLHREALVSGMPEMIELICDKLEIPDYQKGFLVLFSKDQFPGASVYLERQEEEFGGNWYLWSATGMRGWLCPALLKYFAVAPDCIYIDIKPTPKEKS